jgi:hypothetical protein
VNEKRSVTAYLVLERKRGWSRKARIVRHCANPPDLKKGQCAVRISIEVPEAAFEPVLAGPSLAFAVEDILQATAEKEKP